MKLQWSGQAAHDLRIRNFLDPVNPAAAAKTVQALRAAALQSTNHPRIGPPIQRYLPREVRLIVGQYEIRYEIKETTILIVRVWHTREDR